MGTCPRCLLRVHRGANMHKKHFKASGRPKGYWIHRKCPRVFQRRLKDEFRGAWYPS